MGGVSERRVAVEAFSYRTTTNKALLSPYLITFRIEEIRRIAMKDFSNLLNFRESYFFHDDVNK